jgi:hypothetical protein
MRGTRMKIAWMGLILVAFGCGAGEDRDEDPCLDQDCSNHGACRVVSGGAACDCDAGYHVQGLACLEDAADACLGVTCSGHGTCVKDGGSAICDCDAGYHAEDLACVQDAPDACLGVTCSGHGTCVKDGGSAVCDCDAGYHAEGLACLEDATDWPPEIDDLFSAEAGCLLPDCDEDGDAGFQPEGIWTSTVTCLESNCSRMIQGTDARAKPGSVAVEHGIVMGLFRGTCGFDENDNHTQTAHDSTVVSCEQHDEMMDIVSFQIAILHFEGDTASGQAHVFLTGVPNMAGGDCDFLMDVLYEKE